MSLAQPTIIKCSLGLFKISCEYIATYLRVPLDSILQAFDVFVEGITKPFLYVCKYGGRYWTEFMGNSTGRVQVNDFVAVIQQGSCSNCKSEFPDCSVLFFGLFGLHG